ncbi:putative membrane protein [Burkholderia thailandensis MSMB121]|uniref:hypothetical protein n=1 Tax=Burkholderia humptydooensis TaxID=430531 RepID=UPI000327EEEB|nr:hypothetical protein [Burkholderia humptydooensis]AGK50533.1 putative membrane protein [Burkholderia thailandensis MSMB121]
MRPAACRSLPAAFDAVTHGALLAIVLVVEFTRVGHDFLIPMLIAAAGAVAAFRVLARRRERKA